MNIAYLHLGPARHGVRRYGELLAAEARRRQDLLTREEQIALTGGRDDGAAIDAAARRLADVDVVHVQYNLQRNKCVWGRGRQQLRNLRRFRALVGDRLVATLHDVYPVPGAADEDAGRDPAPARRLRRAWWSALPQTSALRELLHDAPLLFVCSHEERRRLETLPGSGKVVVVPHFVEERSLTHRPDEVRSELGLAGARIVTLLGVIHRRKGCDLLVEALPHLPEDVVVVLAGRVAVGGARYLRRLRSRARALGVADRVRFTGYLPEAEMERWLLATHLAVCPFRSLSASGSLATWISARRPVLATDLPQIREYNDLVPGAIRTFRPAAPDAFADAISRHLAEVTDEEDAAIADLCDRLAIRRVFDEHLDHYRRTLVDRHSD